MRHGLILLACAALAVSGCGSNDQADIAANADTGLTADKIMTNDVTAIDAVTGEAANMAADVDYSNLIDEDSAVEGNGSSSNTAKPSTSTAKPASKPASKPAAKPAAKPAPAPAPEPQEPAHTSG